MFVKKIKWFKIYVTNTIHNFMSSHPSPTITKLRQQVNSQVKIVPLLHV